ncbi:hypothetical protein JOQ06_001138 [Pogonophryne albipinna]|uniref:DRBM domain-containing protein n=1 Tax=Pogonophryne albipinna TaxID=1090488 RepID=A0AAD6FIU2_9TELE|nr:hypothetical protein JOQ06_001138 [Pogonophryne albipinna]
MGANTVAPSRVQMIAWFEYRVKVGDDWYPEASGPSKKAARWLAAEEAMNVLKMTLSHLHHLQTPQKDELHAGGVELWGNAQLAEVCQQAKCQNVTILML